MQTGAEKGGQYTKNDSLVGVDSCEKGGAEHGAWAADPSSYPLPLAPPMFVQTPRTVTWS